MGLLIGTLFTVILLNVLFVIHAKHLRRSAEAKLEIAKCVTRIEGMMLKGEIRNNDICHDQLHARMVASQNGYRYQVDWSGLFSQQRKAELVAIQKRLHEEIKSGSELGKVLDAYTRADFKAFRNQRPFASLAFWGFITVATGGLLILLVGLIVTLKACIKAKSVVGVCREKWSEYKANAAEWVVTSVKV